MDHPATLTRALGTALCALLLASGCASLRWGVQKSLRAPGERLTDFPEAVWSEYDCDNQRRPFFVIETNELVPPRVRAGGDFNHRLIYVMCPRRATEVIAGELDTRIRFKGEPLVEQTQSAYEIKPGRWVVDAFVELPQDAEPGIYAYEVRFRSRSLDFEKTLTFHVQSP